MNSKELGFRNSMIASPIKKVLNMLKKKGMFCCVSACYLNSKLSRSVTLFLVVVGYNVYLVGGCVRDMILKQTPKDFDILTSADLKEVTFISYFYLIFELFFYVENSVYQEQCYKQLELRS